MWLLPWKKWLPAVLCLFGTCAAQAVCPEKAISLCEIVMMNSFVAHAKVSSTQHLHDDDDTEGLAGWLYQLDVIRNYRHRAITKAAVHSANTSARLVLQTGKEYIVFGSRDAEGNLETGNYCDPYTEMEFTPELERQVTACIASEKPAGRNAQPTPERLDPR